MRFRTTMIIWASVLFSFLASAYGDDVKPLPKDYLGTAAERMVKKDFQGAIDNASLAPESGRRELLIGMALSREGRWEEAAVRFGKAAGNLPLLADYAMYNKAYALYRLAKYPDALSILQLLIKTYADSPLIRVSRKLQADSLYDGGNFSGALDAYLSFIEKYPSGPDSLDSSYKIALCREKTGNIKSAVESFRNIWIKYPASDVAAKAESDLNRLAGNGVSIAAFSADELMRRGSILYDLGKYKKAAETFDAVPQEKLNDKTRLGLLLKLGQSRFKSRKYLTAEQTLKKLISASPPREIADETRFLLARILDKNGRNDEAFDAYMNFAENSPVSSLADNALLDAYFVRKFQNRRAEALKVLYKLEKGYPNSTLLHTVYWETAMLSYLENDFANAANYFGKLLDSRRWREKSLYWYSKSLASSGDKAEAGKAMDSLAREYPYGYYALRFGGAFTPSSGNPSTANAKPARSSAGQGLLERPAALIELGLYEDARKELYWQKKRNRDNPAKLSGMAELYLKMGDFNGSSNMVDPGRLSAMDSTSISEWILAYPLAYMDVVSQNAGRNKIDDNLVYAIMRAESNYSPTAVSPAGAIGLMQLMPATASAIISSRHGKADIADPEVNIRLGVKHLRDLLDYHDGDLVLAVAAYNAGSGNVRRWLNRLGNLPADLFIENISFPETREYVKRVLAGIEIYKRIYKTPPATPSFMRSGHSTSDQAPSVPVPDNPENKNGNLPPM